MRLLLLKSLLLRTQLNLLKTFKKSIQKDNSFDLILLLSEINKGVFVSAIKCNLLLSLILFIKENMTEKNIKINSTKKNTYSF